jgi:succinate dehydrogenase / fumarate reductase flavoprotein subunit
MSWKHVDDKAKEYNTNFVNVMETDSMLRIVDTVLFGALNRHESRGGHARVDYPYRDDVNFLQHTLAYWPSPTAAVNTNIGSHSSANFGDPIMEWYPVTFTRYAPVERHY